MTTTFPDDALRLTSTTTGGGAVRIGLAGDLDHDTADDLLHAARAHLGLRPPPPALHLDCRELTLCDSMGLATLLTLHRDATAAGTALHLDGRPAFLDRILQLTGTLEHLTSRSAPAAEDETPAHARPPQPT
ncbi:STAS domain-containing protein [Streptomyces sp. DH12]|uniref:STAS domain-containing protein n=1 Tax=Streptomyces sp. DH12 TaxID=2857010 RepID=UPI001E374D65|nr:STAS domain-containing protein [Streptomyces sp. DH12]